MFTRDSRWLMERAIAQLAITLYLWWSITHVPIQLLPTSWSYGFVLFFGFVTWLAFTLSFYYAVDAKWTAMSAVKRKRMPGNESGDGPDVSRITLHEDEMTVQDAPEDTEAKARRQ